MMHALRLAPLTVALAVTPSAFTAGPPVTARAAVFAPQVSVWISDDAPGGHPDITTTIEASSGPMFARTETLSPAGGSTHRRGEIHEGTTVGWIGGFVTVPGPDGRCDQRFLYNDIPVLEANPDTSTFPPFLRELAPGNHLVRYSAEVAGTPVNIIIDEVEVHGVQRLRTTTYVGDQSRALPTCAPFKNRAVLLGRIGQPPTPYTGGAPPTSGPRVYDFTFTSRDGDVVERSVTATVQPGLRLRIEPDRLAWEAVPGVASYQVGGTVFYMTTCEWVRRLVIRETAVQLFQRLPADATSRPFPPPPGPDYEAAQVIAGLMAYDADGVLLARNDLQFSRDAQTCWYPPGEEPLLHVAPEAGSCTGDVTFTGERFPTRLTVEITMPHYGTDGGGPHVAVTSVSADGTFSVTAAMPDSACLYASGYPDNKMLFYAYNADEPKGMTAFAGISYAALIPAGWAAGWEPTTVIPSATGALTGPATGTGPERGRTPRQPAAVLAIAGAMVFGGGVAMWRHRGARQTLLGTQDLETPRLE